MPSLPDTLSRLLAEYRQARREVVLSAVRNPLEGPSILECKALARAATRLAEYLAAEGD